MSERPPSGRRAPPCLCLSPMPFLILQEPACVHRWSSAPRCPPCLPPEDGVGIPSAGPVGWGPWRQGMEPGRRASCWPGPRPSQLPWGDPRLPLAAASWPGPGPGSTVRAAVNEEELGAEQDARAASRGQKSCAFNSMQGRGETGLCRKCLALCPTPEAPSTCCSGEDEMRLQQEMGPKTDRHADGLHPTSCVRALRCA